MGQTETVHYQMIASTEYVEDSGLVITYGISCRAGQGADQIITNISTRSGFVEDLVDKLNRYGADPVHLKDFIYDFLP